jgi:DNA-binding transcriptional MerR regulator
VTTDVAIPNRAVFKAPEVCEIADVQPYVLRSWEAEFPDLGVAKRADGPRIYRRADVELVLKLKHMLLVDGLTLAGARRRLIEEGATAAPEDTESITDADVAAFIDKRAKKSLRDVREGLGWILGMLNRDAPAPRAARAGRARPGKAAAGRARKAVKSKGRAASRTRKSPSKGGRIAKRKKR